MRNIGTKSIGLFPLNLVVLPGEVLRLHIFERKYKKLINECFANNSDFVIPFMQSNQIMAFGTRVKLIDIERFYADGKMDIKVEGVSIVRLDEFIEGVNESDYALGSVREIHPQLTRKQTKYLTNLFNKFSPVDQVRNNRHEYIIETGPYSIASALPLNLNERIALIQAIEDRNKFFSILKDALKLQILVDRQADSLEYKFYLN